MYMRTPTHLRIIALIMLLAAGVTAHAQPKPAYEGREATSSLTVGLGMAGGASMTLDAPESWKIAPVFAWRAGIDATFPLTPIIGASLSLGLDHRGAQAYWHQDIQMWEQRLVDYFYVAPGFQFGAFYLGVNIGFPMQGARRWQNFSFTEENSTELDSEKDQLATMIEPRIGAVIPLMDQEIGWLGLTIGAGYNVSDMSDDPEFMPGSFANQKAGTQTVSLHLGVTWQFAIPGTNQKPADM
jgi:hypothetical protein